MTTMLLPPVAPPPRPEGVDDVRPPDVPADVAVYRRRVRRRLFWWSLAPVLIVALLALKLLSLPAFAGLSQATYDRGSFDATVTSSDGLAPLNVLEPWVRHFDRGTGLARVGVLVDSRAEFEKALTLVPARDVANVCRVRTNLSLVVEQQGDSAVLDGDPTAAARFYAEALTLITASPDGCFDSSDDTGAPPSKKPLNDEKARLEQKQQGSGGTDGDQGQGQGGSDQGQGSQGQGDQGSEGQNGDGQGSGDSGSGDGGSGSSGSGGSGGSGGSAGEDPLDRLQQQNGDAQKEQQENNDRNRQFDKNDGDYSGKPW